MNLALLVVDVQADFYNSSNVNETFSTSLEYINYSIDIFRKNKLPVCFIQDEEAGEGPGSPGFELTTALDTMEKDIYVAKYYSNSFWKTNLEKILKELKVDFVLVCGFAAEACVNYTYNGALERGFQAAILQNGIASYNPQYVDFIQKICRVDSIESLEYFITK